MASRLSRDPAVSSRGNRPVLDLQAELYALKTLDWVVLFSTLTAIISYGLYRARGEQTTASYLLAGRSMPWYAMALSIMATQASAITFISTTGQAYEIGRASCRERVSPRV